MTTTKARSAAGLHRAVLGPGHGGSPLFGRTYGDHRQSLSQVIRRYGMWVHRCVSLNAQVAACVPFKLFSLDGANVLKGGSSGWKGKVLRPMSCKMRHYLQGRNPSLRPSQQLIAKFVNNLDDMVEVTQHPVLDLLNDANPWQDGTQLRESLYSDLQIAGRAFQHVVVDDSGLPIELWRTPVERMKVIPSPTKFVSGYEYGEGADRKVFSVEEILWFRLFDPFDPWGGLGALEAWLRTVDCSNYIQDFQWWLFQRHGSPDYVIKTQAPLTQDQKRSIRSDWRRLFGRLFRRQESIGFLSGNPVPEIERLNQSPRELEFVESQREIRDMIGQAFGVPKSLLTTDDVNRSNARESNEMHVSSTIWPLVGRVESVLNERLLPMFSDRLVLVHENPVPEDRQLRMEERLNMLQTGSSINEVRIEDGQPPIDDPKADEHLMQSGLQPVSQIGKDPFSGLFPSADRAGDSDVSVDDESKGIGSSPNRLPQGHGTAGDFRLPAVSFHSQADWWAQMYAGTLNGHVPCCVKQVHPSSDQLMRSIGTAISAQIRSVVDELVRHGIQDASLEVSNPRWTAEYVAELRPSITRIMQAAGQEAAGALGRTFDVVNPAVEEFIDRYTVRLARRLAGRLELELGEILNDAGNRLSVAEAAQKIRQLDEATTPARALMIARTETARATMTGQIESWKQTGIVAGKRWLLAPDACEFCRALAREFKGRTVPLDEPFYQVGHVLKGVDGGTLRLNYAPVMAPPLHPHDRCDLEPIIAD